MVSRRNAQLESFLRGIISDGEEPDEYEGETDPGKIERDARPSLLRGSDRGGVSPGKILFAENTVTISST